MNEISKRRNGDKATKGLTILLSTDDRERLETVSDAWNTSFAETIRRALANEAERIHEANAAPRLDQIQDSQAKTSLAISKLSIDLSEHKARTEYLVAITKSLENNLKTEIESVGSSSNATAVRLLAMIRTFKNREAIEAEIQRILHGE